MEKAALTHSGEAPRQSFRAHGAEAVTVKAEVQKLEVLIKQFAQKEKEMLATGRDYINQLTRQGQRLGEQIARARGGGSIQSQLIGAAAGALVGAAMNAYNRQQAEKLAEGRKQFAADNIGTLEELGRKLRQAGCDSVSLFSALDRRELVLLDGQSLVGYQLMLKSLADYQRSILHLAERYDVFRTYYAAVSEWAEREPEPALLEPFLDCGRWIEERVKSAEDETRQSSSLLYHFSMQGHLLLFLPRKHKPAVAAFERRARDLFDYYTQPYSGLKIVERFDYVSSARQLLSGSHLAGHVDRRYRHVRRRHSIYRRRYWIAFGVILILFAIVSFFVLLFMFIGAIVAAIAS